jgi:hypothetical protein
LDAAPETLDDDMQVPNWPKYTDPVAEKNEIDRELINVKKEQSLFQSIWKDAEDKLKRASFAQLDSLEDK